MAHGSYLYKWSASSNMAERKCQNKPFIFSFLGFIYIYSLLHFLYTLCCLLLIISCCLELIIDQIKRGSVEVIILRIFISCHNIKIKCERINLYYNIFMYAFHFLSSQQGLNPFMFVFALVANVTYVGRFQTPCPAHRFSSNYLYSSN